MSNQGPTNSTEERALALLGSGNLTSDQVAAAVGVSPSRISQLLSQEDFAVKVAELRYQSLAKHNIHDNKLDDMENDVIDKLKASLEYVFQPMQLLKVLEVINRSVRRGSSTPESINQQQNVLILNIPTVIINKFVTNINNQVTEAGDQKLVTIQSGTLLDRIKASQNQAVTIDHEPQRSLANREAVES